MTTNFQQNGIRYSLLATPTGRRDNDEGVVEVRPDPTMWTSSQKRHSGLFTTGRYASALNDDRPSKRSRRRPDVDKGAGPRLFKPIAAEEFLESAPAE